MSWTDADVASEVPKKPVQAWTDEDVVSPKRSILQKTNDLVYQNVTRPAYGVLEAGTQLASALPAQVAGGLHGLTTLATGGGSEAAARTVEKTSDALTYSPRTQEGKLLSRAVAYLPEKAIEGAEWAGGKVGGAIGGDKGEAAGKFAGRVIPETVATLYGGRAALRAAPEGPSLKQTIGMEKPPVTPEMVRQSRANENVIDAANAARKYNIAIDPAIVNPTPMTKTMSAVAGKQLEEALSAQNRTKWSIPLKRELDMDVDTPISMERLEQVRNSAAEPNSRIAQIGSMFADDAAMAEIRALQPERLIGGKAEANKSAMLINEATEGLRQGMPASRVLDNISTLRREARNIYKRDDAGRPDLAVADTNMGIANALEGLIERHLETSAKNNPGGGFDRLLNDYREGRRKMAKSYVLEDITDFNTGLIDPNKLAKMTAKDNALTGSFQELGNVAGNFPQFSMMHPVQRGWLEERLTRYGMPGIAGTVFGTMVAPGMGSAVGGMVGAGAGLLAKRRAERRIGKPEYQEKYNRPVDYRPERERLGYTDNDMIPTEERLPRLPPVAPLLDEQIAALRREQPQGLPELPPLAEGEVPLLPQQPMIEKVMRGEPPVRQIPTQVSPSGEVPFPQLGAIPEMRPTMELGGGNAPLVEALRGGARIPISGEGPLFRNQPVEFTPGGGMNMPIPIEKASEAVGKLQTMIEEYRQQGMKLPESSQRDAIMQTVRDLEQLLPAIAEQEGLAGIKQKLYGEGQGYPIEKTFSRSE